MLGHACNIRALQIGLQAPPPLQGRLNLRDIFAQVPVDCRFRAGNWIQYVGSGMQCETPAVTLYSNSNVSASAPGLASAHNAVKWTATAMRSPKRMMALRTTKIEMDAALRGRDP
jgi:hypothetical protein